MAGHSRSKNEVASACLGPAASHQQQTVRLRSRPLVLIPYDDGDVPALKSIDEGFADFHGYGVTCTSVTGCLPSFLGVSVSDAAVVKSRSLANNDACMTAPLRTSFKTSLPGAWVSSPDMYQLGTLFASTLYQVGNTAAGVAGVRQMQRALLAAYDDPTPAKLGLSQLVNQNINNPAAFTPEEVANSIAVHIYDLTLRDRWCGEVVERLQLDCPAFTDCPKLPDCRGTSSTSTKCPKVPQ